MMPALSSLPAAAPAPWPKRIGELEGHAGNGEAQKLETTIRCRFGRTSEAADVLGSRPVPFLAEWRNSSDRRSQAPCAFPKPPSYHK